MGQFTNLYSYRGKNIRGSAIRAILSVTQQPGIISFAGGLPSDQAIPNQLIAKLAEEILTDSPQMALQYSLTEGLPHFRQFLSQWLNQRYHTCYTDNETLITTGSQQAIDLTAELLLDPGDALVVERPTYLAALQIFRKVGARLFEAECDQDGLVVESLEKILKKKRIKLIYTNPDHQNPAGFELPTPRRKALVNLAKRYGVIILEDGAYREIRFRAKPLPPIACFDDWRDGSVLFSQTASKILAPGLRVGWIHGPKKIIEKMTLLKQSVDVHTPGLNQEIVYRYLSLGYFDKYLPRIVGLYRHQAETMDKALQEFGKDIFHWQKPKGGLFIWAKVKKRLDMVKLLPNIIKKCQVAYVPGASFFAHNPDRETLRLNFSKSTDEQIWLGIKKLARAL